MSAAARRDALTCPEEVVAQRPQGSAMSKSSFPWHARPGLAGGIDKDGTRAAELLGLGFGSVEFGTVAVGPQAGAELAALRVRLAALPARAPGAAAIGIGLGQPADAAPRTLAACWIAGLYGAWDVADYLSFNLSARACAPLLAPARLPLVEAALRAVAAARAGLPRRVPLALKFRLGGANWANEAPPAVALAAAAAGFDLLTAVLPDDDPKRLSRLHVLITAVSDGPAVVAVGGIRKASDVAEVRASGAAGVQVHRAFSESGATCLAQLLGSA